MITENDCAVIEILDSDEEAELERFTEIEQKDLLKKEQTMSYVICFWPSVFLTKSSRLSLVDFSESEPHASSRSPFDLDDFIEISTTIWEDSDITSWVLEQPFNVTKEFQVERVEYLREIPSVWPIPQRPTAFILDLSAPKFQLYDKDGVLYRVDALIKNKQYFTLPPIVRSDSSDSHRTHRIPIGLHWTPIGLIGLRRTPIGLHRTPMDFCSLLCFFNLDF
jgi:hypothetical protein